MKYSKLFLSILILMVVQITFAAAPREVRTSAKKASQPKRELFEKVEGGFKCPGTCGETFKGHNNLPRLQKHVFDNYPNIARRFLGKGTMRDIRNGTGKFANLKEKPTKTEVEQKTDLEQKADVGTTH